ncbi:MAG: MgtC/SapB family protein, partial [Planctomycetia bacterium]|nr:MgtC/SapB family protein [Planctomycetia bacterium]
MELPIILQKLGLALGLGLLVGLQREYAFSQLAGIRTFPVFTVFGAVCALLGLQFGGWIVGLGAVALAALLVVGNVVKLRTRSIDPSLTTEAAALLMYGVGAYLIVGPASVAVAIAGGLAVLLSWKEPLHGFIQKLGPTDIRAIMQFALITLVILPVLPDRNFGPYQALNPYRSWLMVVLIVGISLGGYVAYKLFGQGMGTMLGGVLGGLISSTATTVSYARRTRGVPESAVLAAAVIAIASTVVFGRVLVEVAVVSPGSLPTMAPPLLIMGAGMALLSSVVYWRAHHELAQLPTPGNPAELQSALIFGGLYALVTLAASAAREHFGTSGLYGVALLSGVHDL